MSIRPPAPAIGRRLRRSAALLLVIPSGFWPLACATPGIPDPRLAAARYAEAVSAKDSRAIYAMLSERSRTRYGQRGVDALLAEAPRELARDAAAATAERATVEARGELRYGSGFVARVSLEDGQTYIDAAGMLPLVPRSPSDTLREFRAALESKSYHALLRLLVSDARAELVAELDGLAEALEEPETLDIRVVGETAIVDAPGGHRVALRKENGVWLVVDFQ